VIELANDYAVVYEPYIQAAVREVGHNYRRVANWLTRERIPAQRAGRWAAQSVKNLVVRYWRLTGRVSSFLTTGFPRQRTLRLALRIAIQGSRMPAICLGVWRGHSSVPRRTLPSGLAGTRPCLAVSRDAWFQFVEMATRPWGIYETSQAITWARLQVVVLRDECGGTESREERRFSRFCRAI
jgi:hypothetical protein